MQPGDPNDTFFPHLPFNSHQSHTHDPDQDTAAALAQLSAQQPVVRSAEAGSQPHDSGDDAGVEVEALVQSQEQDDDEDAELDGDYEEGDDEENDNDDEENGDSDDAMDAEAEESVDEEDEEAEEEEEEAASSSAEEQDQRQLDQHVMRHQLKRRPQLWIRPHQHPIGGGGGFDPAEEPVDLGIDSDSPERIHDIVTVQGQDGSGSGDDFLDDVHNRRRRARSPTHSFASADYVQDLGVDDQDALHDIIRELQSESDGPPRRSRQRINGPRPIFLVVEARPRPQQPPPSAQRRPSGGPGPSNPFGTASDSDEIIGILSDDDVVLGSNAKRKRRGSTPPPAPAPAPSNGQDGEMVNASTSANAKGKGKEKVVPRPLKVALKNTNKRQRAASAQGIPGRDFPFSVVAYILSLLQDDYQGLLGVPLLQAAIAARVKDQGTGSNLHAYRWLFLQSLQGMARYRVVNRQWRDVVDRVLPWLERFCHNFLVFNAAVPPSSNGYLIVTKTLAKLCIPCILNEQDGDLYGQDASGLIPIKSQFGRVRACQYHAHCEDPLDLNERPELLCCHYCLMEPNRDRAIAKKFNNNSIRSLYGEDDDMDDVEHLCCEACRALKFEDSWRIEQWELPMVVELLNDMPFEVLNQRVLRTDTYKRFVNLGKGGSVESVVTEAVVEVQMDHVYAKQSRCKCRICDRARKKRDEDEEKELELDGWGFGDDMSAWSPSPPPRRAR